MVLMAGMRQSRLGDQMRKVIAEIIARKLRDPQLGMVTITDVELTKDLSQAKVFYSVLGDADVQQRSAKSLRKAVGFVQSELGRAIRIRKVPMLEFVVDHSVERGLRIQELLNQIEREDDGKEKH